MSKDKYINNYSNYLGARRCCDINGVGPKGYDGIKGPMGDIGLQGNTGNTGATGFTGIMGKSCRGPTGQIGPSNGPIGSTGYTGPYASFTQGIGININEGPSNNYSIRLSSSADVSYNIYPNYYYNIAINNYGRTNIQFNPIQIVTDLIPVSFTDYLGQKYKVYDFLSTNSFTCISGGIVSMLLIGGGGGGSSGNKCGGAGAGEVLFIDNYYLVKGTTYNIVIGNGGIGGQGGQGGHDGSSTYIFTSDNSFNAVGGAGAVNNNNGKNGLPGILPPNPTLSIGTSSGSGGGNDTASDNSGGLGYSVTYLSGITPYVNTSPNMWSYANNGGNGNIYGGGGGGGSGGSGGISTIDSSCGSAGLGLYINYYTNTVIKPGYVAGGSGSNTSIYGAGQCYSSSNYVDASNNTGSGGGSNPLTSGGSGGSGRLILRFLSYS
jgi:hypothetical protein